MGGRFAQKLLRRSRAVAKDCRLLVENQEFMPRLAKNCREIAF
jgi:hypothetical protein